MAYVRRRGNQLSIVAGERHPTSRKVEQRVLFTFYSRAEALEMVGRGGDPASAARFAEVLDREHPGVRFGWESLRAAVAADLGHLPETYERRTERPAGSLRPDVVALARGIVLAPPPPASDGTARADERAALEYLKDLVTWRLATWDDRPPDAPPTEAAFAWRFATRSPEVPPDAEAHALGFVARGELGRAEGAFRVLTEGFPGYAEGWNQLGLLAIPRGDLDGAERDFRRAVELARARLPKRPGRGSLERDPRALPYARGLAHLTHTLVCAARYDEATELAARIEHECGDPVAASTYRAAIALNEHDWATAARESTTPDAVCPARRILEAFARYESGEPQEALAAFVHGALSAPRATRVVLGRTTDTPRPGLEADDHASGVRLRALLHGYLGARGAEATRYFERVIDDERVAKTVRAMAGLRTSWYADTKKTKEYLDHLTVSQTAAFARTLLRQVPDLVEKGGPAPGGRATRREPPARPAGGGAADPLPGQARLFPDTDSDRGRSRTKP